MGFDGAEKHRAGRGCAVKVSSPIVFWMLRCSLAACFHESQAQLERMIARRDANSPMKIRRARMMPVSRHGKAARSKAEGPAEKEIFRLAEQ